jgi:hypothetical protein
MPLLYLLPDQRLQLMQQVIMQQWDVLFSAPGTYTAYYRCQYTSNINIGPEYLNTGVASPGSITFTTMSGHDAEGYFSAVCKYGTDSVLVSGTFKGYYE